MDRPRASNPRECILSHAQEGTGDDEQIYTTRIPRSADATGMHITQTWGAAAANDDRANMAAGSVSNADNGTQWILRFFDGGERARW